MPTLGEIKSLVSRYVGNLNTANDRINLVRARLLPAANSKDTKQQIILDVYADADGNSIVSLGRGYSAILEGAVRSTNVLCAGSPMGVQNAHTEFSANGLGYGGLNKDFQEVNGHFAVVNEWSDPMRIRLKFEVSESAGTIYLYGTLDNETVWALNTATWERREAIAFSGTSTVTSLKYYDAQGFKAKKPITNGRISVFAVDDNNVETAIAIWDAADTLPRFKRYKVPQCEDVSSIASTAPVTPSQYYTKSELENFFSDAGTISVSAAGTHDLVYAAYFLRIVKVTAAAGSGSYVHTFTLDNSTIKKGGTLRVKLEIAQSANPTISFYDNSLTGTLLQTVNGDAGAAIFETHVFSYDGSAFHWEGREL